MSEINEKLIIEIGINHLGDEHYFKKYVELIIKLKLKYVTIQILDENFYKEDKNKRYFIDPIKIVKNLKLLRKNQIKIGFAVVDSSFVNYVNNYKPDFFKVLSWKANNMKLLTFLFNYNRPVYISLGTLSKRSIISLYKKIRNQFSNFGFIHTQLNYDKSDLNLNFISYLHENTQVPICYGHHAQKSILPIYLALALNVDKVFIYVKLSNKYLHPDEDHAVYISDLPELMGNLKNCMEFLGSTKKKATSNQIAKVARKRKL